MGRARHGVCSLATREAIAAGRASTGRLDPLSARTGAHGAASDRGEPASTDSVPAAISVPGRSPRGTTPAVNSSRTGAEPWGRKAACPVSRLGSPRSASNGGRRRTLRTVTSSTAAKATSGRAGIQMSCSSLASKRGRTSSSSGRNRGGGLTILARRRPERVAVRSARCARRSQLCAHARCTRDGSSSRRRPRPLLRSSGC
jgi:hypothetical protein